MAHGLRGLGLLLHKGLHEFGKPIGAPTQTMP